MMTHTDDDLRTAKRVLTHLREVAIGLSEEGIPHHAIVLGFMQLAVKTATVTRCISPGQMRTLLEGCLKDVAGDD
jgi:hypothetical protein